jgi:hypothetical protein
MSWARLGRRLVDFEVKLREVLFVNPAANVPSEVDIGRSLVTAWQALQPAIDWKTGTRHPRPLTQPFSRSTMRNCGWSGSMLGRERVWSPSRRLGDSHAASTEATVSARGEAGVVSP